MKRSIYLLLVALTAFCFSCSKEKGMGIAADEREVELNILLPGAATRAATPEEKEIKDLTVLVFDGSTNKYLYSRYAYKSSGSADKYTTTLKIRDNVTLYFCANRAGILDDLDNAGITEGDSYTDVLDALILSGKVDMAATGLPMWGMAANKDIKDQAANYLGKIQLVRSVASIEIRMLDNTFTLEHGYVYYAADKGYQPYDASLITEDPVTKDLRATAPYSPPGFATTQELYYKVPSGGREILNKFYVYENATPVDATGTNRNTRVVLGGIWAGGSGNTTYYPLTLRDKNTQGEYDKKQVTRNNKYTIMISKVNGDGYINPGEAKDADDVNWDYDVIEWDDHEDGNIIIDGTKYFYRALSSVTLFRQQGSTAIVNFRTNYEIADIEMKFDGEPETAYTKAASLTHHARFDVQKVDNSGNNAYDCFKFTAKQDYSTPGETEILNVRVGRIEFNIYIEQVDSHPDDWNYGGSIDYEAGK